MSLGDRRQRRPAHMRCRVCYIHSMFLTTIVGGFSILAASTGAGPEPIGSSCCTPSVSTHAVTRETAAQVTPSPAGLSTEGMAWIPAGTFTMGWDGPEGRYDERPAHAVQVEGFWIDRTEVTNAQFREFVEATGYITTAEREVDWEEIRRQLPPGTPKPAEEMLQPGSLVFDPPDHAVDLAAFSQWWAWTPGASWRHPQGPGSDIEGKDHHPVVHVSWDDAAAYARWAGKRLDRKSVV